MRDLIVTENATLDGVIEATGGWFAPAGDDEDVDWSDVLAALTAQREAADAFLVGTATFETMRGYWPRQADDRTGITDYLNGVSKYVVSSTLEDPGWGHTTVLRGPLRDDIGALKAQPGKDIVTTGSVTLVHALIAADLVDEYRLFVHPVVLGRGRRLFEDATAVPKLRLVELDRFAVGSCCCAIGRQLALESSIRGSGYERQLRPRPARILVAQDGVSQLRRERRPGCDLQRLRALLLQRSATRPELGAERARRSASRSAGMVEGSVAWPKKRRSLSVTGRARRRRPACAPFGSRAARARRRPAPPWGG